MNYKSLGEGLKKDIIYGASYAASVLTPLVPGDLQKRIVKYKYPELSAEEINDRASNISRKSSIAEVLESGAVMGYLGYINSNAGLNDVTPFLLPIADGFLRLFASFGNTDPDGDAIGTPTASMAIEVPYQLAKFGYRKAKSAKNSFEEKMREYKTILKE